MSTYKGKCHCGYHEWEVTLNKEEANHILCHCDTCKLFSGGAFTMNQVIPKNQLEMTKGDTPGVYTYYGDSGKGVHCYFCRKCTCHIYHYQEVMGPDTIVVRTILLEGSKGLEVSAEIFGKDRLRWEKEVATTYKALPE